MVAALWKRDSPLQRYKEGAWFTIQRTTGKIQEKKMVGGLDKSDRKGWSKK